MRVYGPNCGRRMLLGSSMNENDERICLPTGDKRSENEITIWRNWIEEMRGTRAAVAGGVTKQSPGGLWN